MTITITTTTLPLHQAPQWTLRRNVRRLVCFMRPTSIPQNQKVKQLYFSPGRTQSTGSSAPPSNAGLALRKPTLFCISQNRLGQNSSFSWPQPSTPYYSKSNHRINPKGNLMPSLTAYISTLSYSTAPHSWRDLLSPSNLPRPHPAILCGSRLLCSTQGLFSTCKVTSLYNVPLFLLSKKAVCQCASAGQTTSVHRRLFSALNSFKYLVQFYLDPKFHLDSYSLL